MSEDIRHKIEDSYLEDEFVAVRRSLEWLNLDRVSRERIAVDATELVIQVRNHDTPGIMQAFLGEYGLSSHEGVALMCLAEALLRVPDAETIDALIHDKIVPHDWASHLGDSGSILVNASTWALMLTGRMLEDSSESVVGVLHELLRRLGEPVVRRAVEVSMREMGEQFVLGQTIREALDRGRAMVDNGYVYSYDMLGEAARTETDALRYLESYRTAIEAIAEQPRPGDLWRNPGISVKLSALHPRYEFTQSARVADEIGERLKHLCLAAKQAGIGLNIDAEEADRLDLSLEVVGRVVDDRLLDGWDGFGVVVQAYGKRALPMLDWLHDLALRCKGRIMVRLVKGAYWDAEIKRAQVLGLNGFPVYTHKACTDVSFLACARKLLAVRDRIYPQFATHNAHTIAALLHMAGKDRESYEFQRLHGMGEALHEIVREQHGTRCRIYAPVGIHRDLLAYLVRRLLENGANSSFVNQIVDRTVAPETVARDPVDLVESLAPVTNANIPLPRELYSPARRNSRGYDWNHPVDCRFLMSLRREWEHETPWRFRLGSEDLVEIRNPADPEDLVGTVRTHATAEVPTMVDAAREMFGIWSHCPPDRRADCLRKAADLYEEGMGEWLALLAREAGKTLTDAILEVREAVDFLRYYAAQPDALERGTHARGVIVCISPWNFPLAIFTGQVAAALMSGNTVLAKPAEQTPLIAHRAVSILHRSGIPADALQLVIGEGETVGAALTSDPQIDGVCFTGSTEVALTINRQLARTASPDAMLVAETGGINAMIVDSTALLERVVDDVMESAFRSAGQRCSALRIIYVQQEIRDRFLEILLGAMDALVVDDPLSLTTDIGPLIDGGSAARIGRYRDGCLAEGRLLGEGGIPSKGNFVPPMVIEVKGIEEVTEEVFGPVLHMATFEASELFRVLEDINRNGHGLTFGLRTRIDRRVQEVINVIRAGNIYVNRNQIGAVVGTQPFGGEGLSGTGPKAGGPNYLRRFRKGPGRSVVTPPDPGQHIPCETVLAALRQLEEISPGEPEDVLRSLREILRGCAAGAMAMSAAMDCGPVDLPGPTGESNQLSLHPMGTVLCLSHDPESLLDRTVQALRSGNRVLAAGNRAAATLAPLMNVGLALRVLDGITQPDCLSGLPLDAVSADETQDLPKIRNVLADRTGPIIRLIPERIYPEAYVLERSICIDTTAAGGDTALLNLSEPT